MPLPLIIAGLATAAAGGIAGLIGAGQQAERQKAQHRLQQEQLKHQKEAAWQKYLLNQGYANTEWNLSKSEALSQLALNESRLDDAVNQNIGQYNTGLAGQALGIQDAQIQNAGSIGALLAGEASSGVRNASGSGLVRSYAERSLERQTALQDRQNRDSLYAMLSGASEAREDIGLERAGWNEGGYKSLKKEAQDRYSLAAAGMEQDSYDWAIQNNADLFDATKINGWDYAAAFLSGGATGWSTGSSIGSAIGQYGDGGAGSGGSGGNGGNSFNSVGGQSAAARPDYMNNLNTLLQNVRMR